VVSVTFILIINWRDKKMSLWDNLMNGNRRHDNGPSIKRGIPSILKTLDPGTVVAEIGAECSWWRNATFLNYDPEANHAFFSVAADPTVNAPATSLSLEADKIDWIEVEMA
jgi:hypothetical protein